MGFNGLAVLLLLSNRPDNKILKKYFQLFKDLSFDLNISSDQLTSNMMIWKAKAKRISADFLMMLTFPASSTLRETVSRNWPRKEISPMATIRYLKHQK